MLKANLSPAKAKVLHSWVSSLISLNEHLTATNSNPGGTNKKIDIDNPANLGQESTDAGSVKNLKWRFSDSKTRQLPGG